MTTPPATATRRSWLWAAVGSVAVLVALLAGYLLGSRSNDLEWISGRAYVGLNQAYMKVDGWAYGVSDSVAWLDRLGSHHDEGWPACLDVPAGTWVEARWAVVPVDLDDFGWREVVLVDCSDAATSGL